MELTHRHLHNMFGALDFFFTGVSKAGVTANYLVVAGGGSSTQQGGGGSGSYLGGTAGTGGTGGGGNGTNSSAQAVSGSANTGGGAGGNGATGNVGANGGSGVVILQIPSSHTATFSGGVTATMSTAVSGYKTYTITATSTTSETVTFS